MWGPLVHRVKERDSVGIMDRITRITRANINAIIDRAEDPVKMANQIIRDLQVAITDARNETVTMIAQQKLLKSELERTQAEVDRQFGLAGKAVLGKRDDLAKEALTRKKAAEEELKLIRQQYDLQMRAVESLKKNLSAVESQYRLAEARRDTMIARARRADSMNRAAQAAAKANVSYDPNSLNQQLDRMDRRISEKEAKSEAILEMTSSSYEAQFHSLDDPGVLQELQSLKDALMPKQLPATTSPDEELDTKLFAPGEWDEADINRELAELKSVI